MTTETTPKPEVSILKLLEDPKIMDELQIILIKRSKKDAMTWIAEDSGKLRDLLNASEGTEIGNKILAIADEETMPVDRDIAYEKLADLVEKQL